MFDFRYKNTANMHDWRIKRTDTLAILRHRRRVAANDERRVCIDRCEAAAPKVPSTPLLDYLMHLRSCSDAEREILALLIDQQLPPTLSASTVDRIHATGLIPAIVQCLTVTGEVNDLLRWCACRIIAQIVLHDNAEHINELNRCNVSTKIVSLFDIDHDRQSDCVSAIISFIIHKTNVACPTFRTELLLLLVNAFVRTTKMKIADLINDTIRVMVDRSEFVGFWGATILPLIYNQIGVPTQADWVLERLISFLSTLTEGIGFHDRTDQIIQHRFVPKLIQLISRPIPIQVAVLRLIKNISKGFDEHICDLIGANLLAPLKEILESSCVKISRHITLDILSNISGGHRTEVVAMINAGFVPIVLNIMLNDDRKSQLLATWIVNNLANRGGIAEINALIRSGALDALCKMLPRPDNDIIINTLGALSQILMSLRQHASFRDVVNTIDECDGMSCIQQLQQHDNADISLLAFEITESLFYHENYFDEFDDAIRELQPVTDGCQFIFEVEDWDTPSLTTIIF